MLLYKQSTVQYGTVRYGTVRYCTVQYDTVRYGRYATVQYGTVQYGTVRYVVSHQENIIILSQLGKIIFLYFCTHNLMIAW